jgi:hypothetical protein
MQVDLLSPGADSSLDFDPALCPPNLVSSELPAGGGKRSFQGIPGVEMEPSGRLWACWYAMDLPRGGEGPGNYVVLACSDDQGKTWREDSLIVHPEEICRTFDPCLWVDDCGVLWIFWAQSAGWYDGRVGVWAARRQQVPGGGSEWTPPRRVCDGIMMNKPVILKNGSWVLPVSVWGLAPMDNIPPEYRHFPGEKTGATVVMSADQGHSWQRRGAAVAEERIFDEHMVIERQDGRLWMLIRTPRGIDESFSEDGGNSWSVPAFSRIPHVNSRFFIRRLASGRLLLITNNPPGPVDATKMTAGVRSHLTAWLSEDDGVTWTGGLCLDEREGVSYPDGVQDSDGRIYVVYDRNRDDDREIHLAILDERDILGGERRLAHICVSSAKIVSRELVATSD